MTNLEKLTAMIEAELGKDASIDKEAVLGWLAGRAIGGVGRGFAAAGRGIASAARGVAGATRATGGFISSGARQFRAGLAGATRAEASAYGTGRGIPRLSILPTGQRLPAPTAATPVSRPPGKRIAPSMPPVAVPAQTAPAAPAPAPAPAPTAKKGGRKAKAPVGAKPADAPGGSTATNVGMMGATMLPVGGGTEEKPAMDMKTIIEKTAKLAANGSDDEKVEALVQVSMESGFEDALVKQARALGYDDGLSKTAADEEKKEDKEESEKKDKDEKKEEEKDEKKKDLPPWLQKAKEKDKDEKESSARPILYNKFTTQDIIGHLAAQWGRHEPVEKDASERRPSASEKLAELIEKELAARPT